MYLTEDSNAIIDALVYVERLHQELTTENGAPALGAQNQVVEAVLADPFLTAYVRDWAEQNRVLEASVQPPHALADRRRLSPPARAVAAEGSARPGMVRLWRSTLTRAFAVLGATESVPFVSARGAENLDC